MRIARWLSGVCCVTAMTAPGIAAQGAPKHEFGVDLSIASVKAEGSSESLFSVQTPVDVRIGFASASTVMLETRFGFAYLSGGGDSQMLFTPGLNAILRIGSGSGPHNLMGAYLTGGAAAQVSRVSSSGTSNSETRFAINVGLGTRLAWGDAAIRPEAFFSQLFKKDNSPAVTSFGLRIGFSFWH